LATRMLKKIKGYLWFIKRFGIMRLIQYEHDRKSGMEIDYSRIFTPEQFKLLEENGLWPIPAAKKEK